MATRIAGGRTTARTSWASPGPFTRKDAAVAAGSEIVEVVVHDDEPERRRASQGDVERVRVEAAKLRQITDRRLGNTTPKWVNSLAGKRL